MKTFTVLVFLLCAISARAQMLNITPYMLDLCRTQTVAIAGGSGYLASSNSLINTVNGTVFDFATNANVTFDSPTNVWVINTPFGLGTNAFITQGAATIGFTAVGNVPTTTERYGQLTITATGTVTFTNPVSVHASDYQSSRTITNGNWAVIAVDVIPGQITNMAIAQFK